MHFIVLALIIIKISSMIKEKERDYEVSSSSFQVCTYSVHKNDE